MEYQQNQHLHIRTLAHEIFVLTGIKIQYRYSNFQKTWIMFYLSLNQRSHCYMSRYYPDNS